MLERLRELIKTRLNEVAAKVQDLQTLQLEMGNYLDRVEQRIGDLHAREEEKVYANIRS
jgi:K+/H+ antiporter YhaU regulatory subunit KhtT